MKVYVCTALIGDYDFLLPVNQYEYNKNWNFICYSDKKRNIKGWEFRELPEQTSGLSVFLKSRYIKVFCESIDDNPGIYIYIDANIQLQKKFIFLYEQFIKSNLSLGLFSHPYRKNIFEEFEVTLNNNKLKNINELAHNQIEKYSEDVNFTKTNLLFENNMIFKISGDIKVKKLMKQWWDELKKWPSRDQFSLPYVVYRSDLKYFLTELDKRKDNDYVSIHGHKMKNFRDVHSFIFARRKRLPYRILLFFWQPVHSVLMKFSQLIG